MFLPHHMAFNFLLYYLQSFGSHHLLCLPCKDQREESNMGLETSLLIVFPLLFLAKSVEVGECCVSVAGVLL